MSRRVRSSCVGSVVGFGFLKSLNSSWYSVTSSSCRTFPSVTVFFSVFHIFRWNHAIVQEIINIPDLAKMIYNLLLIQTLLKEGHDPWLYITCESLDCRLSAVLLSFSVFVIVVCTLLPWNKQNIHISLTIQAAMMYLFFPLHTSDWTHFTEEPGTAKSEALPVSRINSSSFCCVMSLAEQKKKRKKKKGKEKTYTDLHFPCFWARTEKEV